MQKQNMTWLVPVLLALGVAGALWYYWVSVEKAPEPATTALPRPADRPPATAPEPVQPLPERAPRLTERPSLVPLPPLDKSDEYFKLELTNVLGESLDDLLVNSGVIERIVASVDNLPRSHLSERIRPLERLGGQFAVLDQDDGETFTIDSRNYARYDALVDMVAGADLNEVAEIYRRFYPLFQKSYVNLGYPDGYFNDRLVEVIDHLLATPEIGDPVALVRPNVLYEFADPELEKLSSGQKMLLRMGSANRARMKKTLRDFRAIVTAM